MNLYGDGWQEVGEDDFDGPEPPPRGTLAWRRTVLGICAASGYDEYHEALVPVWEWRGWRLGVELMVELLVGLSRSVPHRHELRDSFGRILLRKALSYYEEDERLRHAVELAQDQHADLPPHEAMRRSVAHAERFGKMLDDAIPVWQEALAALVASNYDHAVGEAVIIRYLNTTGERAAQSATMALMLHGTLRATALPSGVKWIEPYLERGSLGAAPASPAAHYGTRLNVADNLMAQLSREWRSSPRASALAADRPRGKKKSRKRCRGCGEYHP